MNKIEIQEMISALADGQLQGDAFAQCVEALAGNPPARDTWRTYHLIGDVLRSGEWAVGTAPAHFMDRFRQRMAQEPVPVNIASAIDFVATEARPATAEGRFDVKESANDASFRWKLVAGFASMAAVAAIGWTALGGLPGGPGPSGQPQLAAAPAQPERAATGAERGVMIRDARLDELLAAHRQFGGASALQMPAGFLRNATFEGPAR